MSPDILLALLLISSCLAVGPDITARDRLVKDLPNGVFAGRKLTPKVRVEVTSLSPLYSSLLF